MRANPKTFALSLTCQRGSILGYSSTDYIGLYPLRLERQRDLIVIVLPS